MTTPIEFPNEDRSNAIRRKIAQHEPLGLRTFTPSQAVFARSAGVFHWTPEGRRLYDYSSGVLVANLGHNPKRWMKRFAAYLGWKPEYIDPVWLRSNEVSPQAGRSAGGSAGASTPATPDYFEACPLTAYNAITEIEALAVERLVKNAQSYPGGEKLDTVMWAASGSEAIQKALWACLAHRAQRDLIVATRYGFHGKKGLAGAVTGCEDDPHRDPRVRFISFPMAEVDDASCYGRPIDLSRYEAELQALVRAYPNRLNCLITEPYLGGSGSYHPPRTYMQLLGRFCREHDVLFILDEVQSNFGRTGSMYAFETYGVSPDFVCVGKGMGNGVPVSAVIGRGDVMASLSYGEASDTWSANPIACAAVLATLDEFETTDILDHARELSRIFFDGLEKLKQWPAIAKVRGEGMVFGVECAAVGKLTAEQVANAVVEACYLGESRVESRESRAGAKRADSKQSNEFEVETVTGIHLLGPLAGKVLRVSPPMTMTEDEARTSLELFYRMVDALSNRLAGRKVATARQSSG